MHTTLDYTTDTARTPVVAATAPALVEYSPKEALFFQGDPGDHIFHVQRGSVMLTMTTETGKEAVVGIVGPGTFLGEETLAGSRERRVTATAVTPCTVQVLPRQQVWQSLQHFHDFRRLFLSSILSRTIRLERDLADQLLHTAQQRLARALLLMAGTSEPDEDMVTIPPISQELLANIVGTTRARINYFMNAFRKQGLLTYDQHGITIRRSLLGRDPVVN